MVSALAHDHGRDRVADGVALAAAAARPAGSTTGSRGSSGRTSRRTPPGRSCRRRSAATRCASTRAPSGIPGTRAPIAGTVLLERALGGAATVTLAAIGFVLAVGQLQRRRVHLDRGGVRRRDGGARACCCSRAGRAGRWRGSSRCCGGCGSSARCARSTRRSTRTGTVRALLVGVFALTVARAGGARARDLGRGPRPWASRSRRGRTT